MTTKSALAPVIGVLLGALALGSGPAAAEVTPAPRLTTPVILGFPGSWSLVLGTRDCQETHPRALACRRRMWLPLSAAHKPPEFTRHVEYESDVFVGPRAARAAADHTVAGIRALSPPADPSAFGNFTVHRSSKDGYHHVLVTYTYLGPHQRNRVMMVAHGRRLTTLTLSSATPLGPFPTGPAVGVLWRRLDTLTR